MTDAPKTRRLVGEQSPHDFGIALDGQQQRAGLGVRRAPVLLPIRRV